MTILALAVGTLGLAFLGLFVVGLMLAVVKAVLPHDPPPLVDGESIHSRLVKLPPPIRHTVRW